MSIPVRNALHAAKIKHFYGSKYLLNPRIHERILDKLSLEKIYKNSHKLKILDLYPGPGQHSAILYNRFNPTQYGLMETRPDFLAALHDNYDGYALQLFQKDPYEWSSYTSLIDEEKKFVPEQQSGDRLNDRFLVVANLTNASQEGLLMQWFNCIGNRNWLQRFGLVKMLLWVPVSAAAKLMAVPSMQLRSKCSVVREAFTNTKLVAISDATAKKQFDEIIWKESAPIVFDNEETHPTRGSGIALLEVNPKSHTIDLDNWDYITKHLLILKKTPLRDAVESLGHGAKEYFSQRIKDPNFLNKCPVDLTNEEFIFLADLFNLWPFKPDIYVDFIDVYQEEGLM
ncbi:MTF1 (YMR228W) [Zygosaccharomyces parabailii]|uniref:rRNA adenine N(6)-methyltransferase n=1 Tax=Zygosaccharomyces bailii (strain CLIB 213 / ATCC 58445 / CBS 680 / BCRC 21525 / NBRC 1098 / NCYC 1416 / NRRL Y-2227) TaxID=1333698 RepID=A0A8J2X706_ZYGB2|nr:MTF1 (YMR228W) [Zygosaccharomyces parabailii]CDF88726.1 ZYBA0S03-00518g1_1 [Zygosaccharomyces bailii CLIB 213]